MSDSQLGGRSLGGDSSEPLPASWARPVNSQPRIGRIGGASGGAHSGHARDGDDESEGGEEGESWFAGGERRWVIMLSGYFLYILPDSPFVLVESRSKTLIGLASQEVIWSETCYVEQLSKFVHLCVLMQVVNYRCL